MQLEENRPIVGFFRNKLNSYQAMRRRSAIVFPPLDGCHRFSLDGRVQADALQHAGRVLLGRVGESVEVGVIQAAIARADVVDQIDERGAGNLLGVDA